MNDMKRPNPLYWSVRALAWMTMHTFLWLSIRNRHKVPKKGGMIVVCNHTSNIDPVILGISTPRFVRFMAKAELFQNRWFGVFIRNLGAFPIRRGSSDRSAIRQALNVTAEGGCLAIFPEGHRSRDGKLGKGMTGAAFLARKAGCVVVPAAISGRYGLFRRITVRFGEPIQPVVDTSNEEFMKILMDRIAKLLQEKDKVDTSEHNLIT